MDNCILDDCLGTAVSLKLEDHGVCILTRRWHDLKHPEQISVSLANVQYQIKDIEMSATNEEILAHWVHRLCTKLNSTMVACNRKCFTPDTIFYYSPVEIDNKFNLICKIWPIEILKTTLHSERFKKENAYIWRLYG